MGLEAIVLHNFYYCQTKAKDGPPWRLTKYSSYTSKPALFTPLRAPLHAHISSEVSQRWRNSKYCVQTDSYHITLTCTSFFSPKDYGTATYFRKTEQTVQLYFYAKNP